MSKPEHYALAEQLLAQADTWMDADTGWKANLSTAERLAHRAADLATAQVHATLALVPARAELPACEACGSTRGPLVPDSSGARYANGAQVLACATSCTPVPVPAAEALPVAIAYDAEADE